MSLGPRSFSIVSGLILGLGVLAGSAALAGEMVSVKGSILNMRTGPGTNNEILWELKKGYPLEVLARKGRWLKVKDFENDRGWVARSLTGHTPFHIVKANKANLRKGPGTGYRVIGQAEYGELLRTREKQRGWVRVERDSGTSGWVSKKLLWGW